MRIRPSFVRIFGWLTIPAMVAASFYFGYCALYGERGYARLQQVRSELSGANTKLAALTDKRLRLEHSIDLLKAGDPDLIEELARTKLMDGAPGQVAIPRHP